MTTNVEPETFHSVASSADGDTNCFRHYLFGCKPVGLQPIGVLPELHYVMFVCRLQSVCPFHRYQVEAQLEGLRPARRNCVGRSDDASLWCQ